MGYSFPCDICSARLFSFLALEDRSMRKRTWFLLISGLLLVVVAVLLRWPRIESGLVLVIQSRPQADAVEWQYRMRQPFEVALCHWLEEQKPPPPTTGIVISSSKIIRKERVGLFKARYDLLRGEYVVTMRLIKGDELRAEINGERVVIPLWSGKPRQTEFVPVSSIGGDRIFLGDTVGKAVASIPAGKSEEETLVIYAGTNVEEYSR
jgi:hypothetical protein